VQRHFSRIFGSLRKKKKVKGGGDGELEVKGQSQWNLVHDGEEDESSSSSSPPDWADFQPEFSVKLEMIDDSEQTREPSLLSRALSFRKSRRKGDARRKQEEKNRLEEEDEKERKEIAAAVLEINATLGLLQEYHHSFKDDEEGITRIHTKADVTNTMEPCPMMSSAKEEISSFPVLHVPDEVRTRTPCDEEILVLKTRSNFRRQRTFQWPARDFYRSLIRRRNKRSHSFDDLSVPNQSRPSPSPRANWMTRSFLKVTRRRVTDKVPEPPPQPKAIHCENCYEHFGQQPEINAGRGSVLRKSFRKGLWSFAKVMKFASDGMPLPCECPVDSGLPQMYWEDDNEAIYEFRRYCEARKWNEQEETTK